MAPVKTTQGTFRYRVTSLSRDNLLVESENKASALPCVRLPTRKISSFGHSGEQLYALFYALQSPLTFFLSLSILSFFAYSLIYFHFFFLFLHKVPKSSLALAYNNRCPSISPRALTNATRETCSHFLWGSENKIRSMAHTDTRTHTSYVRLEGSWSWWVKVVMSGGQRWK